MFYLHFQSEKNVEDFNEQKLHDYFGNYGEIESIEVKGP